MPVASRAESSPGRNVAMSETAGQSDSHIVLVLEKRCDVASILWTALSSLSQRDYRTEPGVLTPGVDKIRCRPAGAVESLPQIGKTLTRRAAGPNYLPPLQGGSSLNVFLGLKPQAESCSPFGTKNLPDACPQNRSHPSAFNVLKTFQSPLGVKTDLHIASRHIGGVTTLPTEDEDEADCERVTSRPGLLGGERRREPSICLLPIRKRFLY
jgi:hypothetical protein